MTIKIFIFFISFNFLKPILMPIFRYFNFFDFAVLVYPGTKKDVSTYMPFDFFRKIAPRISIVGFIRKGKGKKRGIILATKYYIEEIKQKKDEVLKDIERFANLLDVKKVALVGRLPKMLFDSNRSLFVEGKIGTVFTVINSVRTIISKLNLRYKDVSIGVVGIGFIGKEVLNNLKEMGFSSITAFDTRFEENLIIEDNIKKGKDPSLLRECDLLIILTPGGDDVESLIPFFKGSVIVLDDTHPFMSRKNINRIEREKNGSVYKVAVALEGASIFPKIPGFRKNWIPGCVVETIVALYDKRMWNGQVEFNKIANEIGFRAISEKSTGENF